MTEKSWFDF